MTEDLWAAATSSRNGRPVVMRFIQELRRPIDIDRYPFLVAVAWPYDSANGSGMPDGPTNDRQVLLEDLLDPALEARGNAYLVWVATGDDLKIWRWYSENVETTMEIINDALAGQDSFPIEIEANEDLGWTTWREFLSTVSTPDDTEPGRKK